MALKSRLKITRKRGENLENTQEKRRKDDNFLFSVFVPGNEMSYHAFDVDANDLEDSFSRSSSRRRRTHSSSSEKYWSVGPFLLPPTRVKQGLAIAAAFGLLLLVFSAAFVGKAPGKTQSIMQPATLVRADSATLEKSLEEETQGRIQQLKKVWRKLVICA